MLGENPQVVEILHPAIGTAECHHGLELLRDRGFDRIGEQLNRVAAQKHRVLDHSRADEGQAAKAHRDPVAPAERSEEALQKALTCTPPDGTAAHSLRTSLEDLSSIVRNTCRAPGSVERFGTFDLTTTPTAKQRRAMELIEQITA